MEETLTPRTPPPETIAAFVKVQRAFYGWKQDMLAALAGVSLSTVERVERGEPVRASSLEKLALALNKEPDAFTAPRVPLSTEEAAANLADSFSWTEGCVSVAVAPLRKQNQLRQITSTALAIVTSDLGEDSAGDVAELQEWLDLASFVRAEDGNFLPKRERSFPLRKLYQDVLTAVGDLERRHKAVCLVRTYEAKSNMVGFETVNVAIVAIRSREKNPASGGIRHLMAEAVVDMRAAMQSTLERMD